MKEHTVKNKQKKQTQQPTFFSELGVFMRPYTFKYVLSTILSIISVACSIGAFAFVGLIGRYLFILNPDWSKVMIYLILAIVCKIINAILINSSTWLSHKAAFFTLRDIRHALVEKMLKLPMGYFEVNGSGRLKTLFVDHVEGMEKTLAHMIPELTANILVPLICTIWMFVIDWRLALCVLGWIIIGMSTSGGMMKNYEEKYNMQIAKFKGMNQAIVEYVNGIEVMKIFGRTDCIYDKYTNAIYEHANFNINWMKGLQIYSALGMAIAPFSLFPVVFAGIFFFANGTLESSTLFMMVLLTFGIFGPLMNAMNYFDQLAAMNTNAQQVSQVLKHKELKRGSLASCDDYSIQCKNVDFSYNSDKKALKGINFTVHSKQMFALVGPSGSGKSTIAKLCAGYWDCDSGEILIGGHNINEYSQEYLNKIIAYVDQDTFLFDKSIKDNIRLACPDASDEEVILASKKAGCDEFISALADGYDTLVGDAGDKLSGGERQRIAIIRAMMKNAPIMIMDEATASTDPENEASIQKALSVACKDKTLIVIAHRLYTIKNAQQIAFVRDGQIIDIGSHEQLLQSCSDYNKLWNIGEGENND